MPKVVKEYNFSARIANEINKWYYICLENRLEQGFKLYVEEDRKDIVLSHESFKCEKEAKNRMIEWFEIIYEMHKLKLLLKTAD